MGNKLFRLEVNFGNGGMGLNLEEIDFLETVNEYATEEQYNKICYWVEKAKVNDYLDMGDINIWRLE